MDSRQLKDPAAGVPRDLLPHLHLISRQRYPMIANPGLDAILQYLVEAPRVMREVAPVQWQYLDAPQDGTLFLTWQPSEYMNMNFASDGYIWGDAESDFKSDVRGYVVQMFIHRTGWKPQAENVATHSRRRYRLLPSNQVGAPSPDPHLWLVHYSRADPKYQHPIASLPIPPHIGQVFQARQVIQRSGQLPRKEFMLHDRSQWPVIQLPVALARPGSGGQIGHRRGTSLDMQATLEEEEDVSRGDVLDFITPREISRMRYEQHHEWMEEILESPYATKQIVPSELGLGRKGTLEHFTNGFFTAPVSTTSDPVEGKVGKMESEKSKEFFKQANDKLAEMQSELEKMKQEHLRRMEKLRKTTDLGAAERKLRSMNPADDSYKGIAAQVQNIMGRKIEHVERVHQVAKGGLQDIRPIIQEPEYNNVQQPTPQVQAQSQPQVQAQNTQAGLQQQQQAQPQPQQTSQPEAKAHPSPSQQQTQPTAQPQVTDQSHSPPEVQAQAQIQQGDTPTQVSQPESHAKTTPDPEIPNEQLQNNDAIDGADIDMGDLVETAGNDNEWDMLNDQPSTENSQPPEEQDMVQQNIEPEDQQVTEQPSLQPSNNNTPAGDVNEFDMVTDFDTNMDTAGDALADYNPDDDLNLDDSAFGDAFHHHQQEQDMS